MTKTPHTEATDYIHDLVRFNPKINKDLRVLGIQRPGSDSDGPLLLDLSDGTTIFVSVYRSGEEPTP